MGELMTIEEIEARHTPEWVLIDDPQVDEYSHLWAGRVIAHSLDRDEIYRKAVELRLPHFAVRCFGKMADNTALVL